MAIFTKAEDLFSSAEQSVGGNPTEGGNGNESVRIFQPDRGLDVLIPNVGYLDREEGDFSTGVSASFDGRKTLGTITLNNRDFWENSNYNENTFGPYLTGLREVVDGQEVVNVQMYSQTFNGNVTRRIVVNEKRNESTTFKFTIDAIPFVVNPNTDEIVRLDRYYDKDIDTERYNLATEGNISYYIYPRGDGRTPVGNLDTYGYKGLKTKNGFNVFDSYASEGGPDAKGYSIFRLDWGDGTPLEHTTKPKILEGTTLLEHVYKKPGFYTIKGVVMAFDGFNIGSWEKFETNILLNPSDNYDVKLYDDNNFITIGGLSSDSVLVKSATDIIGVDALTLDDSKASNSQIRNINLFDRLNLFNFLSKVDDDIISKFNSIISPYEKDIFDVPQQRLVEDYIFGCLDPEAENYQPNSDSDLSGGRTLCQYNLELNFSAVPSTDSMKITLYFLNSSNLDGLYQSPPDDEPEVIVDNRGNTISNPNATTGRKAAIINQLGSQWIDINDLEDVAYQTLDIYTNPSGNQPNNTIVTRDTLRDAVQILVGADPLSTGGSQFIDVNISTNVVDPNDGRIVPSISFSNLNTAVVQNFNVNSNMRRVGNEWEVYNVKRYGFNRINAQNIQEVDSTINGGINGSHSVVIEAFTGNSGGGGLRGPGGV